jgi:integrase/recombinase XerD
MAPFFALEAERKAPMLEQVFRRVRVRQRIRDNPIGPVLERYVAYLVARGHRSSPIHQYVFAAEHFGRWLGKRGINRHRVRLFIERHLSGCHCTTPAAGNLNCVRAALNRLLEMIGTPEATPPSHRGFVRRLLPQYAHHLESVQDLATATIGYRLRYARSLLRRCRIRRTAQLAELTPDGVRRFVCGEGRRCRPSSGQVMACSIRTFLRFLQFQGLVTRDLANAVPTFANWRLAPLPATVSARELERLTRPCDTTSPSGLRDRAILLCLIELGLRASDVADLRLDGVDLAANVLRLRRRKQREPAELPMPPRLTHPSITTSRRC